MRINQALRSVVVSFTLCLLLASAALTLAQETTASEPTPVAEIQGVGTLFLLIGLGAVGLVSLVWLARERSVSADE